MKVIFFHLLIAFLMRIPTITQKINSMFHKGDVMEAYSAKILYEIRTFLKVGQPSFAFKLIRSVFIIFLVSCSSKLDIVSSLQYLKVLRKSAWWLDFTAKYVTMYSAYFERLPKFYYFQNIRFYKQGIIQRRLLNISTNILSGDRSNKMRFPFVWKTIDLNGVGRFFKRDVKHCQYIFISIFILGAKYTREE